MERCRSATAALAYGGSRTSLCTPWPTPYGPSSLVLASSVARAAGTWRWSWARPWPPIAAFLTEMLVATACWRTGAKSLSVRDILNRARALRHRLATVGGQRRHRYGPGPDRRGMASMPSCAPVSYTHLRAHE